MIDKSAAMASSNPAAHSLAIITVTYNSSREITDFVASLASQNVAVDLWLVDNASSDATPLVLRQLHSPHIKIHTLFNERNLGLAAANNIPIPHLQSEYIAIINPDVILQPNALGQLTKLLAECPNVVAAAPVNIDEDGSPHSSFHRDWGLRHLFVWRLLPSVVTRWLYQRARTYNQQDVLFASGACIVMRTSDYTAIGGYDPEYFLTVEDVCDLCIRLRRGDMRKRVVIVPTARITHLKSRSAVAAPFITLWHGARGSIYHFRKHRGWLAGFVAFAIVLLAAIVRTFLALIRIPLNAEYKLSFRNNARVVRNLLLSNPLFVGRHK
jgi:N-acetylglucosaminyl-diphospho-decaprenol L-rhamnosyltransferase